MEQPTYIFYASQAYSPQSITSDDMTTPHSFRHHRNAKASEMQKKLKSDFDGVTYKYDDAETWIHRIFDLSKEEVQHFDKHVDDGTWTIDPDHIKNYQRVLQRHTTLEPTLYPLFQQLCNTFLDDVEASPLPGQTSPNDPIRVWQGTGQKHLHSDTAKFDKKPDIVFIPRSKFRRLENKPAPSKIPPVTKANDKAFVLDWGSIAHPLEMKLSPYVERRSETVVDEDDIFSAPIAPSPFQSHTLAPRAKAAPRIRTPLRTAPANLLKRSRLPSDDDGDDFAPPSKKLCTFTTKDAQLGTYVAEATLSTYRMFVIGVSIRDDKLRLWYYDAMGTMSTMQFNFLSDTRTLMLTLFAMSLRSGSEVGYNPFHKGEKGQHAVQWDDSYFVFHDEDSKSYTYLFDGEQPIFIAREILHRRTLVLPVLPDGPKPTPLALKFSFVDPRHRAEETKTIANILKLAPELAPYLPRLDFSRLYDSSADLGLPRFILDPSLQLDIRHLLVSVTPRYAPLWEARNLEEFKQAFIDIVECHHRAYVTGKVLHRDISEGNLMLHRIHDHARGILLDFDNASLVDERGDVIESGATQRTGTAPFMAYDLLKENHPPHLYRHELESFFYFLVWASVHFKLSEQRRLPPVDLFTPWCVDRDSQLRRARDTKWAFLTDAEEADNYWTACGPEFQPLLETWLKPLRTMFRRGLQRCRDEDSGVVDFKTVDGFLTYETFMKAIKVEPRRWT